MAAAFNLDDEIIPVDALGKRWSKWGEERPPLHPLEKMRLLHDGAVLGGDRKLIPDDINAWDECLWDGSLSEEKALLLRVWYTKKPHIKADLIAARLKMSRQTLYREWNKALYNMKGALRAKGVRL